MQREILCLEKLFSMLYAIFLINEKEFRKNIKRILMKKYYTLKFFLVNILHLHSFTLEADLLATPPIIIIIKITYIFNWRNNKQFLTLFRMGGGEKAPPTSFSPVTSTNVRLRPQNFLTFSFGTFDRLV